MAAFMYSHSLQSVKVYSGGHLLPSRRKYPSPFLKKNAPSIVSACIPKSQKDLSVASPEVLHPQSMGPAREGDIPVTVKNSYNPKAPGTLITRAQDTIKAVLSDKALNVFAILLCCVSNFVLVQLRKDKSEVIELAKRLYNSSWCVKYACLLFLIVSFFVNGGMSLVINWIATVKDGGTAASREEEL